jgi:hypothetical protein
MRSTDHARIVYELPSSNVVLERTLLHIQSSKFPNQPTTSDITCSMTLLTEKMGLNLDQFFFDY